MMTLEYALQIRMFDKNMTDRKYRPSKSILCESHSHSYAGQHELDIKAWGLLHASTAGKGLKDGFCFRMSCLRLPTR